MVAMLAGAWPKQRFFIGGLAHFRFILTQGNALESFVGRISDRKTASHFFGNALLATEIIGRKTHAQAFRIIY